MLSDDAEIMRRVQAGELSAFDELASRYRPALVRAAESKLGDAARAEDVVQDALLAAFAARHTYRPEFAFRTWLWTILLNLCRRHYARQQQRPKEAGIAVESIASQCAADTSPSVLDALVLAERHEQLSDMLQRLPDVQADALRLRFFGGLKYDEIAQTMGCSLNGAKMRVRNGLAALAQLANHSQLRDYLGDSP